MEEELEHTIALFGESEKGEFRCAYFCENLAQLDQYLGNPPPLSLGLHYAVQALLYKRKLIYFRIPEEGYSTEDYLYGLQLLKEQKLIPYLSAICAPGLADAQLIGKILPICNFYHSILITNEPDFYDYLTN